MTSNLHTGAYVLQVALLNDNNYPMGQLVTPNSPVNGTSYNPLVVPSLVGFEAADDTSEEASSFGGQKKRGTRDLGVSELGDITITVSEFDDVFDALVLGYTVDTATAANLRMTSRNVNRTRPRKLLLGFTAAATPVNSTPNFATIFMWGTLRRTALGSNQGTGRNPNNRVYTLKKFVSTRTPFGQLFSAAGVNPDGDSDDEYVITASAPMSLSTYVDDGSTTSLVMPYAPDSTEHAGATNLFFKNGTVNHTGVSGISSATATITAGSAADIWNTLVPSSAILDVI